jgi:hypothetical protein
LNHNYVLQELYLQFDEEPTFPSYKEHIPTLPIINHKSPARPGQLGFLVYLKDWLVQFSPVRKSSACVCMEAIRDMTVSGMPSAKVFGISVLNLQSIC